MTSALPLPPTASFRADFSPVPTNRGQGDIRNRFPRFADQNVAQNQKIVARLAEIVNRQGHHPIPTRHCLGPCQKSLIIPVIGARTCAQLSEILAALEVRLTSEEITAIETAVPADAAAGTRYDAHQMQVLDSEK